MRDPMRGKDLTEVEFVCCNPEFPDATDPQRQMALMGDLTNIKGLHVYRQDFGDGQTSLAAILKENAPRGTMRRIREISANHGVDIDMVESAPISRIDDLENGQLEYVTHYFNT